MGRAGGRPARLYRIAVLLAAVPLLVSCTGVQSALDPGGEEAAQVATLFWVMTAGATVIWAFVVALSLYASLWKRTTIGALLALSPRPLYGAGEVTCFGVVLDAGQDQHICGVVMLMVGAVVYLAGGLTLVRRLLEAERGTAKAACSDKWSEGTHARMSE